MTTMTQSTPASPTFSLPNLLIRLEGLAVFLGAIAVYAHLGGSALLFIVLLFAPDVSMIGYLRDTRLGAITYNSVHTYAVPLLLLGAAFVAGWSSGVLLALIWLAHIGLDRTVGYGLKYAADFKDTHLNRV